MTHFLIASVSSKGKVRKYYNKYFLNDKEFDEFVNKEIYNKGYFVKAIHNAKATTNVYFNNGKITLTIGDTVNDLKNKISNLYNNSIKKKAIKITAFDTDTKPTDLLYTLGTCDIKIDLGITKINKTIECNNYRI